jgi:hypothetical protein
LPDLKEEGVLKTSKWPSKGIKERINFLYTSIFLSICPLSFSYPEQVSYVFNKEDLIFIFPKPRDSTERLQAVLDE